MYATRGEHLVQELLWVHGILRSDLQTVSRLATEVLSGREPEGVREDIARLKSQSPLWQLKVNCLYYCRFVHAHHSGEDAHLFPALRRSNPALETVVDKLEADHRKVADILDEVERSSDDLVQHDTLERREQLVSSLNLLTEHLMAHLDYEEESISPTLRTWDRWPFF